MQIDAIKQNTGSFASGLLKEVETFVAVLGRPLSIILLHPSQRCVMPLGLLFVRSNVFIFFLCSDFPLSSFFPLLGYSDLINFKSRLLFGADILPFGFQGSPLIPTHGLLHLVHDSR